MTSNEDFDAIDPFPDVHALFLHYNALYFDDSLGACSVEWSSSRMTLYAASLAVQFQADAFKWRYQVWLFSLRCAGICQYERGGGCRIKLSEPLLKVYLGSTAAVNSIEQCPNLFCSAVPPQP